MKLVIIEPAVEGQEQAAAEAAAAAEKTPREATGEQSPTKEEFE
jgi:hypothetical protein